ncbi:MAG: phosphatase PAP2 family protein [Candidatus Diapherotrites archaeon]
MVFWFDVSALHLVQQFANPLLDIFFLAVTELGNPLFWLFIAAFIYWQGKEDDSFFIVNLITFSAAISGMLKFGVARPRPDASEFRVIARGIMMHSFPSAHATLAASAYGYFSAGSKILRRLALALLVLLVAVSRIYLGAHFLTDVLAGLLIGYAIGKANFLLKQRLKGAKFRLTKIGDELGLVVAVAAAVAAIVFVQPMSIAQGIFGFYAGFFAFKYFGQPQCGGKCMHPALKHGIGAIGLCALVLPAYSGMLGNALLDGLLYFLAGLWISFLWPLLSSGIRRRE